MSTETSHPTYRQSGPTTADVHRWIERRRTDGEGDPELNAVQARALRKALTRDAIISPEEARARGIDHDPTRPDGDVRPTSGLPIWIYQLDQQGRWRPIKYAYNLTQLSHGLVGGRSWDERDVERLAVVPRPR